MLESLAAWVLRTYVGEYVENLNTDQLSIGYGKSGLRINMLASMYSLRSIMCVMLALHVDVWAHELTFHHWCL